MRVLAGDAPSAGAPPTRRRVTTLAAAPSSPPGAEPAYARYTLDRYHASLARLASHRGIYAATLVVSVLVAGFVLVASRVPTTPIGQDLQWLTLVWLLPVPILLMTVVLYFGWFRVDRFRIHRALPGGTDPSATVIFQVTSTGLNVGTVLNTVRSVLYWTRRLQPLTFRPEVWLVVEEWGYLPNRASYDPLAGEGVRLIVTPSAYRTARGTTRKGRALQYALERRAELAGPLDRCWVYHQDDETAIGEDTVLGLDEFVREHGACKAVGCGIILYPQHAEDLRPSQIQEFARSKDDLRTLYTITSHYNVFSGFHGSHYVARADLEDEIGWDVGPDMNSEDLIFETRVRERFGPVFHLLKGFAYEQAAFTLADQLRQRRRWFQGWWRAVVRLRYPPVRRVVMTYGMIVWMSAILSVTAMVLSWAFDYSAVFGYAGVLTGFVWAAMIEGYHQGYTLHVEYLPPRHVPLWRVVANGIVGALSDALAPWYGTFTRRPRTFQVISKDRRAPAEHRGPSPAPA